jgi:hypothetical protein
MLNKSNSNYNYELTFFLIIKINESLTTLENYNSNIHSSMSKNKGYNKRH